MKHCIIYTRFSPRPDAEECDSCKKQRERCIGYANNSNREYAISSSHSDENVSGGRLFRPGLNKALEALNPGWILIVDRADRLARDIAVGLAIRMQVKDLGCTIEYVDGTPSGDSPEDTLFQNIMSSFATYERDRTRFNTKRAMAKKKENCERVGQVPIGWRLDIEDPEGKKLIKYEIEWDAIKEICREKYHGQSIKEITVNLNMPCLMGKVWKLDRVWNTKTVRRLWKKHRFWACPATGDPELEPNHPI